MKRRVVTMVWAKMHFRFFATVRLLYYLIGCEPKTEKHVRLLFALRLTQIANIVSGPRCLTGCPCKYWKAETLTCESLTKLLERRSGFFVSSPPSQGMSVQGLESGHVDVCITHETFVTG